jgi:NAD(P)-dependent dehydrogenase (short-subunit alcohol dehydrogenase family)
MGGSLRNKVAVVTGSGQGLGKAFAVNFAEEGARVVVNDLSPQEGMAEKTAKLIKDNGGEAITVYGDVGSMAFCEKLIGAAIDTWGTIDVLVNNAGVNRDKMVWNMSEEDWDAVVDVVLKGTFACTRFASAHMRKQGGGRIINITSQAGISGNSGQPNYSAAKGGVIGFTKSCALALGRSGITVNAIAPQADTRIWRTVTPERAREMGVTRGLITADEAAKIPDEEVHAKVFGLSDDIAPLVTYLAGDHAGNINGQLFFASGGRISIYAQPIQERSIYSKERWTVKELELIVPVALTSGILNPAPAPPALQKGP